MNSGWSNVPEPMLVFEACSLSRVLVKADRVEPIFHPCSGGRALCVHSIDKGWVWERCVMLR
jgi:hypothetical protein